MARMAAARSSFLKTALPATMTLAPAAQIWPAFCSETPPSTSIMGLTPCSLASARTLATLATELGMNFWPPKPGFTVMTRTMSTSSMMESSMQTGVAGLMATAGRTPDSRR